MLMASIYIDIKTKQNGKKRKKMKTPKWSEDKNCMQINCDFNFDLVLNKWKCFIRN